MRVIGPIYFAGFLAVLYFQPLVAPNATWQLMVLRAVLWPLYVMTGIPRGTPLPMD